MKVQQKDVPGEMLARQQWVGARLTERPGGKLEKQPINPHTGGLAKVNDPATWGAFEAALAWRNRQPPQPGVRCAVGYVFTENDPHVGIDLDHCYDERSNRAAWATELIERFNSYTELSVSGTGVHIIVKGQLPPGGRRKGQVEMYDRSRFFVFTGDHVEGTPRTVEERTAALAEAHRELFGTVAQVSRLAGQPQPAQAKACATTRLGDQEVIERASAAPNGAVFGRLWAGQWQGLYPSQSEADLALCCHLAFWTNRDAAQMERLFRYSGLYRPKWDERHFADGRAYGQERIQVAIANTPEGYGSRAGQGRARPAPEDRGYGLGEAADFFPVKADAEEPEWLAEHPVADEMRGGPEKALAQITQAVTQPLAPPPVAPQIVAAIKELEEGGACPPLPEGIQVDPALGRAACPWLDAFIAYSRSWVSVAYDPFHEANGLFLLSMVVGRRAVVHLNGPHYGNLSIAFVARSSMFRKTTTVRVALELLEAAGLSYLRAPSDSTPEAFIKKLAERGPSDWSGLTGERLRELEEKVAFAGQKGWIHNEFGGKLDKISQDTGPMAGFSPLLRELDDCPSRYEYSTTGRGDAVVEQPYVALLVSMTPADLLKHASRRSPLWSNGFWPRFVIICPPPDLRPQSAPSREGERTPPPALVQALRQLHERLGIPQVAREVIEAADKSKRTEVTVLRPPVKAHALGEGVREAYDRYLAALEQLAYDLHLEALDGGYTRLAEKTLRVALLLAVASGAERIELRHWARAQEIAERWRRGLHHLWAAVNGSEGGPTTTVEQAKVQAEERILRELRKRGSEGASLNQLRQGTGLSAETCSDIVKQLLEAGVIKAVRANRENKPVYVVES